MSVLLAAASSVEETKSLWMPEVAGGFADNVDFLVRFILWVCYFFVALIGGLMVYFSVKYRQKDKQEVGHGAHHSTPLEIAWTLPPLVIVLIIFAVGFTGYLDMSTPPKAGNAYEVRAEAYKWGWNFYYPNGAVTETLYVPSDRPTLLTLESKDVIHSLYVPAFRAKKDVVPGRFNQMWFEPDPDLFGDDTGDEADKANDPDAGETEIAFPLYCTEYCGQNHSQMITECVVVRADAWEAKLEEINIWNRQDLPPAKLGLEIYSGRGGCSACHSLDGTPGTGPTWKDLYGNPNHPLASGENVAADYEYINNSIRNPNAQYAAGYGSGGMAAYPETQLNAGDIAGLVEFMKTISVHTGNRADLESFPEDYKGEEPLPDDAAQTLGDAETAPQSQDNPDGDKFAPKPEMSGELSGGQDDPERVVPDNE